mmetsp:Transcript_40596/g.114977  ORF Transcript_40596/g.114977 Transcript_40596/m.114977 type:complete len:223 (-) Transcript_40596:1344-2012(-)
MQGEHPTSQSRSWQRPGPLLAAAQTRGRRGRTPAALCLGQRARGTSPGAPTPPPRMRSRCQPSRRGGGHPWRGVRPTPGRSRVASSWAGSSVCQAEGGGRPGCGRGSCRLSPRASVGGPAASPPPLNRWPPPPPPPPPARGCPPSRGTGRRGQRTPDTSATARDPRPLTAGCGRRCRYVRRCCTTRCRRRRPMLCLTSTGCGWRTLWGRRGARWRRRGTSRS